uniref:Uncharacterized protein n=1 Tax=viral metagenome TaxID=1070528 RepID=A0A6M3JJP6_9ZZZZ
MEFEDLKGKTLTSIKGGVGDEEMIFTDSEGCQYKLYYEHD